MTWRLRTSSREVRVVTRAAQVAVLAGMVAAAAMAGPVSGRVELRDSKDPAVRKGLDYSGVVVWLEPVNAALPPARTGLKARMDQRNKTFVPHVLAVEAGTSIDFPNSDPIFHNAFSNYNGRQFDIGLYPPGSSKSVLFGRPGIVRVFCNIHASMSAVIVVLDTPYYATTQKDGTYRIANVPPGTYQLRVFHERATEATLTQAAKLITVDSGPMVAPALPISESGYLAIPHSNKFGHDYHDPPDENGVYPAVHK
ncbi:MAG: carboxypeptidase regulatory-like domain-containing protein [Acidobacteriota bacterium]